MNTSIVSEATLHVQFTMYSLIACNGFTRRTVTYYNLTQVVYAFGMTKAIHMTNESRRDKHLHVQDVCLRVAQKIQRGIVDRGGFPMDTHGSSDDQFRPPVCDKSELTFDTMRTHTTRRNSKLFSPTGSCVGEIVTRHVHNLDTFNSRLPKKTKMQVLTKNSLGLLTRDAGIEIGERNVLIAAQDGIVYLGEQAGRHVHALRPVAGNYQQQLLTWFRELTK